LRFLSPVYFIDEVVVLGNEDNHAIEARLLASLGLTRIPEMDGNKILTKERIRLYYARQRELVAKAAKPTRRRFAPAASQQRSEGAQLAARSELPECSLCLSRPSGALMLPCGHTSTCHDCALQLQKHGIHGNRRCPICRTCIEKVLQADCPIKAEILAEATPGSWNMLARMHTCMSTSANALRRKVRAESAA
jgi:hypothetical protein